MTFEEFNFILEDRIAKIKAINEQYDLLNNAYISFSGGKDSVVLSLLIDLALPNNNIQRVYANTGIEYISMVKYVKGRAKIDKRIVILNQTRNIRKTLDEYGYPFKSKEHSLRVEQYNKGSNANYIKNYIDYNRPLGFKCPKALLYQFETRGKYNYSNKCCYKLKKELVHNWSIKNNYNMVITGMRSEEGGNRTHLTCLTNKGKHFHPLIVVSDEWENYFIKYFNIKLCELYYPPFNFKRTGCKGCPFNMDIEKTLWTLFQVLPNEYKQCLHIWGNVYKEYLRIGYRIKSLPTEVK